MPSVGGSSELRRGGRASLIGAGALVGLFGAALVATAVGVEIARFPDSSTYLHVDWGGGSGRLPVVPMLFVAAGSDGARVAAQVALATLAWGALAVVASRTLRTAVARLTATLGLLLLAIAPAVSEWNVAILSESTAISLTAAAVAAWMCWLASGDVRVFWGAVVVTIAFTFTRQLHVPVTVVLAAGVLAVARVRGGDRRHLRAGAMLLVVACFLAALLSIQNREIPRSNAMSIIVDRVAADAEAREYFDDRGLPSLDARQRGLVGRYLGNEEAFLEDRRLVAWVDDHFLRTYGMFLASHPEQLSTEPASHADEILATPARYARPRVLLPAVSTRIYGPRALVGLLVAAVAIAAVNARRSRFWRAVPTVAGFALLVVGVAWALVVFLLSANELPRLGVPAGVAVRVGLLLVVTSGLDAVLRPQRGGTAYAAPVAAPRPIGAPDIAG